jgi:hypothetical protein
MEEINFPSVENMAAEDDLTRIDFEVIDSQELTGPIARNAGIADLTIRDCHLYLRFQIIQFGTFKGRDFNAEEACLIIMKATFHSVQTRFKSAYIDLKFQAPVPGGPAEIFSLAPGSINGDLTLVDHFKSLSFQIPFPTPVTTASPVLAASKATSYTTQEHIVIHGSPRGVDIPDRAVWTINEAKVSGGGIPREVDLAVVVKCGRESGFTIEPRVDAVVAGNLGGDWIRRLVGKGKGVSKKSVTTEHEANGLQFENGVPEFDKICFEKRYPKLANMGVVGSFLLLQITKTINSL